MTRITEKLLDRLVTLRDGGRVPTSSLPGELVARLHADGVLVRMAQGSRSQMRVPNRQAFLRALANISPELRDLDKSRTLLATTATRAAQAADTGDSKLRMSRTWTGFPVNCYETIEVTIGGETRVLEPTKGMGMIVFDWQTFLIPADVVVVGIENVENFVRIHDQRPFFERLLPGERLLFVSRYPQNGDLRRWLAEVVPNRYAHFGDFDLAGISIFLSEFHKHLPGRSSFLIPPDIESRIAQGSTERYDAQYSRFRNLTTDIPALRQLIDTIRRYRRCYDQEGYIDRGLL